LLHKHAHACIRTAPKTDPIVASTHLLHQIAAHFQTIFPAHAHTCMHKSCAHVEKKIHVLGRDTLSHLGVPVHHSIPVCFGGEFKHVHWRASSQAQQWLSLGTLRVCAWDCSTAAQITGTKCPSTDCWERSRRMHTYKGLLWSHRLMECWKMRKTLGC